MLTHKSITEKEKFNKLLKDKEGLHYAWLLDEEGDYFRVEFHNDNCVNLSTCGSSFLTLNSQNISLMQTLLEQSNKIY